VVFEILTAVETEELVAAGVERSVYLVFVAYLALVSVDFNGLEISRGFKRQLINEFIPLIVESIQVSQVLFLVRFDFFLLFLFNLLDLPVLFKLFWVVFHQRELVHS
jgi:hypothetical protein